MKTKCEYSGTLFIISRKYSFDFSKSALTPRYTSEGRLPLCNTRSEARALPSEVRIENDSDRKFSKSNIFQSFSGNHFCPRFTFMVPCSLSAENILRFFEVRTYHSINQPFWNRCFPLVMQSRKAGFPFATRARKREPCLQRYVSRKTRTENFRSQFFFKVFWKPLISTFYGTLFIISRKYFFGF